MLENDLGMQPCCSFHPGIPSVYTVSLTQDSGGGDIFLYVWSHRQENPFQLTLGHFLKMKSHPPVEEQFLDCEDPGFKAERAPFRGFKYSWLKIDDV